MQLSCQLTATVAGILSLLLFSVMQLYKPVLAASKLGTLFGGFLGSLLFMFSLTCFGNFEMMAFGENFQARIVPEVVLCMLGALFASGLVHRVCVTTCFLFSVIALFYMNKISQDEYNVPASAAVAAKSAKKKKQ